jgi:hypothetical protein
MRAEFGEPERVQLWNSQRAKALIDGLRPSLKLVDEAQTHPVMLFSNGLQYSQEMPHLFGAYLLSRLGAIEMELLSEASDFEAIERVAARSLRLCQDLTHRGTFPQQIASVATELRTMDAIKSAYLNRLNVTPPQYQAMISIIASHEAACKNRLIEGIKAEYVECGNSLWGLEHGTVTPEDIDAETMTPDFAARINYALEWQGLNQLFDFVLSDYINEPYHLILKRPNRYGDRVMGMKEHIKSGAEVSALTGGSLGAPIVVVLIAPGIEKMQNILAIRQAWFGCVTAMLQVRYFQAVHHRLPATLDEVYEAAGEAAIPTDPYTGEQLKYLEDCVGAGRAAVYIASGHVGRSERRGAFRLVVATPWQNIGRIADGISESCDSASK